MATANSKRTSSSAPRRSLPKGHNEIQWYFDDAGPYPTFKFTHAFYTFVDDLQTLVRMGAIELRNDAAIGFRTVGGFSGSRRRTNGEAVTEHFADKLIERDTRFKMSMARVLAGSSLPDFELPKVKR